jgi:hypothetical protein
MNEQTVMDANAAAHRFAEAEQAVRVAYLAAGFRVSLGITSGEKAELLAELLALTERALGVWHEATDLLTNVVQRVPAPWLARYRGVVVAQDQIREALEFVEIGQRVEAEFEQAQA